MSHAETRQLGVGYRTAPPSAGPVAAGDRAPDAALRDPAGSPVRLFELFRGPHPTVLAFGAPAPEGEHTWSVCRQGAMVPGALTAVDDDAFAAYGATEGTTVHVRPDGHVARIEIARTVVR